MSGHRFGVWSFDPDQGLLYNGREQHHLRPQSARVLERLLQSPSAVVSRSELKELLWPGSVLVDFDTGINSCINEIRVALGETASHPVHVWTVPKRGFRFVQSRQDSTWQWNRFGLIMLLATVLVVVAGILLGDRFFPARQPGFVVAVLPFDDLSGTPESKRLQSILLADLVLSIGSLNLKRLDTVSRMRVLAVELEGRSPRQIGEELGATHLLDGTIRRIKGAHIVTISLVGVDDERFIWGELVEIYDNNEESGGIDSLRTAARAEIQALIDRDLKSPAESMPVTD